MCDDVITHDDGIVFDGVNARYDASVLNVVSGWNVAQRTPFKF
jgi:hypothetical protein